MYGVSGCVVCIRVELSLYVPFMYTQADSVVVVVVVMIGNLIYEQIFGYRAREHETNKITRRVCIFGSVREWKKQNELKCMRVYG